jgi:hypothetical protein
LALELLELERVQVLLRRGIHNNLNIINNTPT